MNWRHTLTVILFIAAIASGWSAWQLSRPAPVESSIARPDFILHDYEVVSLNKQGREAFTLRGPVLQRNPNDQTMTMANPLFLVPDKTGQYWKMQGEEGFVPADGRTIELRGVVQANSPEHVPPATRIETTDLHINLTDNTATSNTAVSITRPGLTMQGTGLEADFNRQHISLLSQVKTHYVPNP